MKKTLATLIAACATLMAGKLAAQDELQSAIAAYDYKAAVTVLDSMITSARGDSSLVRDLTLQKVQCLKRLYRINDAIAALASISPGEEEGVLEVHDEEVLAELADAYMINNDYNNAAYCYSTLVYFNPDNIYFKIRLASLKFRLESYDESAAIGKSILQTDTIATIAALVGDSYNKLSQPDSAMAYYNIAKSANPANASTISKISNLLLAEEKYPEVIALTSEYLEDYPGNITANSIKGLAQYLNKNYPDAIETFKYQVELGDESYPTWYYLGLSQEGQGLLNNAEESFTRAYQIDSSKVDIVYHLATSKAWQKYKFHPESIRLLGKALDMMQPDSTMMYKIYSAYAQGYMREETWSGALTMYQNALKYKPDDLNTIASIGICHHRLGELKEAETHYSRYLKGAPKGTNTYERISSAYVMVKADLFMQEKN